jgi:hypothetical protein
VRTESEAEWAWLGTQFREANSAPRIKRAIGVQRPLLADAYAVAGGNDEKAARIPREPRTASVMGCATALPGLRKAMPAVRQSASYRRCQVFVTTSIGQPSLA